MEIMKINAIYNRYIYVVKIGYILYQSSIVNSDNDSH